MEKGAFPLVLLILDGWGLNQEKEGNAVYCAATPNMDKYWREYPATILGAAGESVGLPAGQMGNSEVGHLNLGAGRIVYQDYTRISKAIADGDFFENPIFRDAMAAAREKQGPCTCWGFFPMAGFTAIWSTSMPC